jgi:hypothetical protein
MGVNITHQFPKGDLSPQGTFYVAAFVKLLVIDARAEPILAGRFFPDSRGVIIGENLLQPKSVSAHVKALAAHRRWAQSAPNYLLSVLT